jgi:BirA family biotin operon repressor/biotin-[acetyl-CoA-carboxylase] ligase
MTPRWRIRRVSVTASTNDDVCKAAAAGEPEGLVVVAERQTAGRGRQGRVWESPEGNLYFSVLLRPPHIPRDAGLYSFVAALAVRDAVSESLSCIRVPLDTGFRRDDDVVVKWPNDVLAGGRKIGGILLEVEGGALIIGIGLNVAHHPDEVLYPATSLAAEGAGAVEVPALLDRLLERLGRWHDLLQSEGFAPLRAAWLAHAQTGALTVRLPNETLSGTFAGIDEQGRLRLRLEGGAERSISTGDVFFSPKD